MKYKISIFIVLCMTASCSARDKLEMPLIPNPPPDWEPFSTATLQASECPELEGVYAEPPLIHRSGKTKRFVPSDNLDMYSSYIPFHLGDRSVLRTGAVDYTDNHFKITQPDPAQFFIVYKNRPTDEVVQLHFRQSDGDFECANGMIRFPEYQVTGMVEGSSLNFQIRNIIAKDNSGALVIQSTRGPYRGVSGELNNEFSYEFIRYPSVERD